MSGRQQLIYVVGLVLLSIVHAAGANPIVYPPSLGAGYKVVTEPDTNRIELSIRNSSGSSLQFTGDGVSITGPDAADFQIAQMPVMTAIPSGGVRHCLIDFKPSSIGSKQASVIITTDSSTSPTITVPITGNSVAPRGTTVSGMYDGYGPGISTIGPGGDYKSLFAATEAIRRHPLTGGDWTFLITGDLMEENNSILGQRSTNGHQITFRPAPGTSATVTFTTTAQNMTPLPGHFIIGAYVTYDVGNTRLRPCPTHNITIDGSDVPGGQTQSLTFSNLSTTQTTSLLHVYGNSDHVKIRNCTYLQTPYSGPGDAGIIDFAAINNFPYDSFSPPDEVADYGEISNCVISTTGTGTNFRPGITVNRRTGQSPPYHIDPGSVGMRITSNTVTNLYSCMDVRYCADAEISSNSLDIEFAEPPYRNSGSRSGIYSSVYQPEGGSTTTTITGNRIRFIGEGPTTKRLTGLQVESTETTNNILITNNMISGLTAHSTSLPESSFVPVYGIINSGDNLCTVTIAHNSIQFVEDDDARGTAPRCAAIANSTINQYFAGTSVIRNNIIRMGTAGSCAIMSLPRASYMPPATILSDYNIIHNAPGSYAAYMVQDNGIALPYVTVAEWNAATGNDGNSRLHDPFVAQAPGLGTWHGAPGDFTPNLHFTSDPGDGYRVPATGLVSSDFDGDPRPPLLTLAGADEIAELPSAVSDWSVY